MNWLGRMRSALEGMTVRLSVLQFPFIGLLLWQTIDVQADESIRFNRDIRPILAEKCFACHGPSAKREEGQARLDQRDDLIKPGPEGKRILAPGEPNASEFVRRILSEDEHLRMPPVESKKSLTAAEKETLVRWVKAGAPYEKHWAFIPPQRSAVPSVKTPNWARNELDRFVLERLEQEKLTPSPPAQKSTLLRRLSLDLIGLPPTTQELAVFLSDASPEAYSRQVEGLLQSPHYGERWGRLWLDGARYADSDGFEKDKPRFVSMYRDWVIHALNNDLPYNEFVIDQIAGDLRPHATQDQRVATGFLRNSMINEEGGVDPEQFRMEAMFDRMDAIGKSILGLTIQCSQCHSHKYDPLTQEEYYRMFAFLNNSHEGSISTYTPEQQARRDEILHQIQALEERSRGDVSDWQERMSAWEQTVRGREALWTVVQTAEDDASGGQKMYRMKDGSFLCQGYAPTKHTVEVKVTTTAPLITAFRLEQLNDPNLPMGGPGRSIQGTSALTEFKVQAWPTGKPDQAVWVKFKQAVASANAPEKPLSPIYFDKTDRKRIIGPVDFAIDGKDETAWGIDVDPVRRNRTCQAVFIAETPISNPEGTELKFQLVQNHGGWNSDDNQNHNLGRFRLAVTAADDAAVDLVPPAIRSILQIPREQRTAEQSAAAFSAWRQLSPECTAITAQIESLWQQLPEPTSQLVLQERDEPRMTSLLNRGDFLKPAHKVQPGTPAFLHPLHSGEAAPTRLDFARWLVDRQSPTTARSIVNRVWQAYFGEGLVSTTDDLGIQSDLPTHPELLDWLAVEFMERGWSLKQLHRTIVLSATYQQSSRVTPELASRDPKNRLLARGSRFRVDAETVRDVALAISGLLERKVGGASVHPPAPDFLFTPPASYGPKVWNEDQGPDRYRRAIYTFRFRSVPYPMLQAFDAPNGDVSCVRRSRSNTPLQALTTLNEPIFIECAQALALRLVNESKTEPAQKVKYLFATAVSREPSPRETELILKLWNTERERFASGELNPWDLAARNPQQPPALPEGVTAADLAAWTAVSRVILNLDETITRE